MLNDNEILIAQEKNEKKLIKTHFFYLCISSAMMFIGFHTK